jgi:hypothetical protein
LPKKPIVSTVQPVETDMSRHRQSLRGLGLAVLIASSGCMALNPHPIPLAPECTTDCAEIPCSCRGKVYVFLMSGFDLFDMDRVNDFRTALIHAGFTKVYNGQFYHDTYFASEIHRLALEEPDARFVIVGFSLGADYAVSLAESVGHYGIPVSLLASVDPYWWSSAPTTNPPNVQQVMHIHGEPLLFPNRTSAGMDVQIPETFPTNITSNPLTVEALARALASVADTLPHPAPANDPPQLSDDSPTPRPVHRAEGPRDSWDFLKPIASLKSLAVDEAAVAAQPGGERTSLRPVLPLVPN